MTKYDIMVEALQERVNSGELTMEEAEVLNNVAFEKYGDDETEYEEVTESSEDEGVNYDEYLESMEYELFGEATRLAKEIDKKHQELTDQIEECIRKSNVIKSKLYHGKYTLDNAEREKLEQELDECRDTIKKLESRRFKVSDANSIVASDNIKFSNRMLQKGIDEYNSDIQHNKDERRRIRKEIKEDFPTIKSKIKNLDTIKCRKMPIGDLYKRDKELKKDLDKRKLVHDDEVDYFLSHGTKAKQIQKDTKYMKSIFSTKK